MRKWTLFLGLYFAICMLAACGMKDAPILPNAPAGLPAEEETCGPGVPYELTCRIVDGAETGQLMLAEQGDAGSGIYMLSLDSLPAEVQFAEPLRNGQLINVYFETVMESYPMQFGGLSAIEIVEGGFDDRCALYLTVLQDLWEVDPGLNDGVEFVGVDLAGTSLTSAEQAAVGWAFAGSHGVQCISGTLEDLMEQGWITATPLSGSGSGTDAGAPQYYFYEWETGCHFSIVEEPMEGVYSLTPVTFDAQKWRSSMGAYFFSDCTAVQSALGEWSDYQIGAEAIS